MKRLLTDKELQKEISAVISSKNKKLITVGNAIYCEILPSGRSSFYLRIKDRIKDKRIPLGRYPENSLKCASKKAEEILKRHNEKMQVIKGTSKITFGEYSEKWVLTKKSNPKLEHTHKNNKYFFNVKSALKKLKKLKNEYLSQITPSVVDEVLDDIKCAQYAKFHAIQILNQCLNCAVSEGLLLNNLCASMLKEGSIWLNKYGRPKIEGFAYVEPYKLKAEFYEKVESLREKYKFFLLLLSFTMLRNGALAQSKWEWVDFDTRVDPSAIGFMKVLYRQLCNADSLDTPCSSDSAVGKLENNANAGRDSVSDIEAATLMVLPPLVRSKLAELQIKAGSANQSGGESAGGVFIREQIKPIALNVAYNFTQEMFATMSAQTKSSKGSTSIKEVGKQVVNAKNDIYKQYDVLAKKYGTLDRTLQNLDALLKNYDNIPLASSMPLDSTIGNYTNGNK